MLALACPRPVGFKLSCHQLKHTLCMVQAFQKKQPGCHVQKKAGELEREKAESAGREQRERAERERELDK